MTLSNRLASWIRPAAFLGQNWVSLLGAVLTTTSAITMIAFWVFEIAVGGGATAYPYAGIILFLALPSVFVIGLILMPIGAWWRHHKLHGRGELPAAYPRVDFNNAGFRKAASLVAYVTMANIILFTVAAYRGVQYMDSVRFCGATCHTVMQPEYTAYLDSAHSRVDCVQCHIGPGASWFVRSKVSGVRQVFAVMLHDYPRPIPSPVESLRPARATCEQCHWPQRFLGNPILVINHYADDQSNTSSTTVLVMKVGGQMGDQMQGIHGHHLDPGVRITYVAIDKERQVIPQVSYTDPSGKTTVYTSTDTKPTPAQLAAGEHRVMDCMDCHNRPTHTFQLPGDALDQAMSRGLINTDLPFIKKQALAALKVNYPDQPAAETQIAETLQNFYQTNYPNVVASQSGQLQAAIHEVQLIYSRNVFPKMDVTWGTYINDLGHMNWPGCFRCHDGSHVSKDGKTIPNDCDTCHHILAMSEHNPKILSDLGMK
ncbi:MAG TPA: NapC/NirT family cytochrome c [Candidatus Dormibacteraeota bacterium]|nr:NapC/NirT family cytochrome c [Candidatus Dormibacteraeota bacterium]